MVSLSPMILILASLHVGCKQQWSEHGSMWHATDALGRGGWMAAKSHDLLPARQVEVQPIGGCAVDAKSWLKAVDERVVVDGVERCWDVNADQSNDFLVGGRVHRVCNLQQHHFRGVCLVAVSVYPLQFSFRRKLAEKMWLSWILANFYAFLATKKLK